MSFSTVTALYAHIRIHLRLFNWEKRRLLTASSRFARLTCSSVGDGWCRHGDGNANPAAAAVLPAAAPPAAATERGTEAESGRVMLIYTFRGSRSP